MAITGITKLIAIAAEESALPTMPAPGGSVTWATPWDTLIGGDAEDMYLEPDSLNFEPKEKIIQIDPPLALATLDEKVLKNSIESFSFGITNVDEDVLALDSLASDEGDYITSGTAITYYAVAVEIDGKGVMYFPKCRVKSMLSDAGPETMAKVSVECVPLGTDTIPAGWAFYKFNGS